jgi:hypothetical protein
MSPPVDSVSDAMATLYSMLECFTLHSVCIYQAEKSYTLVFKLLT